MKNNQTGTVQVKFLVFIVILCAASLVVFSKLQHKKQVNAMISQIASLGATVARQSTHAYQIAEKYKGNYALFLRQTNNLPAGLSYVGEAINISNNAKVNATLDTNGVVILEVSNLDTNSCVKIATTNWGSRKTTQFVGVGIGEAPDFSCLAANNCKFNYIAAFSGTDDYPFTVERAEIPCSLSEKAKQPATVYLGYKL